MMRMVRIHHLVAFAVALDYHVLIQVHHCVARPNEHPHRPAGCDADRLPIALGGNGVVFARFARRNREPMKRSWVTLS